MAQDGFSVVHEGATITLAGELRAADITRFLELCATIDQGTERVLDLRELDLADGMAATAAMNAVRALRARTGRLVVRGAPQVFAHSLYRVGMLADAGLVLIDTREEEPYE